MILERIFSVNVMKVANHRCCYRNEVLPQIYIVMGMENTRVIIHHFLPDQGLLMFQ